MWKQEYLECLLRSVDRYYIEIFTSNSIGVSAQPHCKDEEHEVKENDDC